MSRARSLMKSGGWCGSEAACSFWAIWKRVAMPISASGIG